MKKLQLIYIALILLFLSCNQEDEQSSNLRIEDLKYGRGTTGHGDNQIGYAGVDLHLEAQVYGDELASEVFVTVESLTDTSFVLFDYSQYYEGRRNTFIHEHPVIPVYFDTGSYHVELTVIDQKGEKAVEGGELIIVPVIQFLDVELEGEIIAGETITIAFQLHGLNVLKDLYIKLVDNHDNEIFSNFYDFTIANTNIIDFNDRIQIPTDLPAGDYFVKAIATDAKSNSVTETFNF
ncbi:DUF4625 domain-containing protein [Flammeovirga aprica]|uniref:DUF4625 domain-containing protein n=1 Tax=Flammeovirga aprica JL-4 TaxID=694437 RepID=A0A7X9S1Y6_9BACT|nr:DUF4625 domain-containing protein [Flammeovirga aprica]NME72804.1 DUF4625 domain-containing protein [Flammeovirga aprica JL-4]